jgi:hypothetical protein
MDYPPVNEHRCDDVEKPPFVDHFPRETMGGAPYVFICFLCLPLFTVVYRVSCGAVIPRWSPGRAGHGMADSAARTSWERNPRQAPSHEKAVLPGERRWTEVNGVLGTTQKMLLDVGWSWGFIRLYNALLFHLYFWKKKAHHKRMWFQCWAWFISPLDTQEAGQAHQQGMAIAVDTAVAVVPSYSKLWRKWKRISMSSSDWRRPTLWSSDGFD